MEKTTPSILSEESDHGGWIVTFADLVTLLLVFFVLMFSISSMNLEKFRAVMKSIQANLGEAVPMVEKTDLADFQQVGLEDLSSSQRTMIQDLEHSIQERQMGEHIVLRWDGKRIYISIKGAVLFDSGSAQLNEEVIPILGDIIRIIARNPDYKVNIKGHTDNRPISTPQFHSNWELSAIRATTVLQYLIENGIDPTRLTATGYGDLLPIAPNDSEEHRSMNRRVEFVLEKRAE